MKLTLEQFREIIETVESAGHDPSDYSGRGMYGKRCLSVTCDNPLVTLSEIISEHANRASCDDEVTDTVTFIDWLGKPEQDSMGLSSVLYFPAVLWQDLDE